MPKSKHGIRPDLWASEQHCPSRALRWQRVGPTTWTWAWNSLFSATGEGTALFLSILRRRIFSLIRININTVNSMLRALRIIMITQSQPLAHQQGWWLIGTVFLKCPHRLHYKHWTIGRPCGSRAICCRCVCRRSPPFWFWRVSYPTYSDSVCYKVLVQTWSVLCFDRGSVEFSQHTIVGDMVFRQIWHNFFHKTRRIFLKKGNIQTLIWRILSSWHRWLSRITSRCTLVPKKIINRGKKVLQKTKIYTSEGSQFSP